MTMLPNIQRMDPVALIKMSEATDKKEDLQEMSDIFEGADANKDGLLNREEFVDYMQKTSAREHKLYGDSAKFTDGELQFHYEDFYNKFTPGVDGVSFEDLTGVLEIFESMQEA